MENKIIEFNIDSSNYGNQILVFNDDNLDVILRNNSKTIRNHNKENKNIKYKITIEKYDFLENKF